MAAAEFLNLFLLDLQPAMDQCLQRSLKRTRTEELDVDEPLKRLKIHSIPSPTVHPAFSAAQALQSPDQSLDGSTSSRFDQSVLKPFTITTKKNMEYSQINELLHTVHVMRHGDPEARESWWEHSGNVDINMDEDTRIAAATGYESVNAALRQAFLQRHHHNL
ncbi:hypothetical protein BJV82DRAFT_604190 [Fennellomyces sp. T-0311]|nr:hypothetical protein BJV82DRAFT_604190 [Fennellomyces sp. T-0311]